MKYFTYALITSVSLACLSFGAHAGGGEKGEFEKNLATIQQNPPQVGEKRKREEEKGWDLPRHRRDPYYKEEITPRAAKTNYTRALKNLSTSDIGSRRSHLGKAIFYSKHLEDSEARLQAAYDRYIQTGLQFGGEHILDIVLYNQVRECFLLKKGLHAEFERKFSYAALEPWKARLDFSGRVSRQHKVLALLEGHNFNLCHPALREVNRITGQFFTPMGSLRDRFIGFVCDEIWVRQKEGEVGKPTDVRQQYDYVYNHLEQLLKTEAMPDTFKTTLHYIMARVSEQYVTGKEGAGEIPPLYLESIATRTIGHYGSCSRLLGEGRDSKQVRDLADQFKFWFLKKVISIPALLRAKNTEQLVEELIRRTDQELSVISSISKYFGALSDKERRHNFLMASNIGYFEEDHARALIADNDFEKAIEYCDHVRKQPAHRVPASFMRFVIFRKMSEANAMTSEHLTRFEAFLEEFSGEGYCCGELVRSLPQEADHYGAVEYFLRSDFDKNRKAAVLNNYLRFGMNEESFDKCMLLLGMLDDPILVAQIILETNRGGFGSRLSAASLIQLNNMVVTVSDAYMTAHQYSLQNLRLLECFYLYKHQNWCAARGENKGHSELLQRLKLRIEQLKKDEIKVGIEQQKWRFNLGSIYAKEGNASEEQRVGYAAVRHAIRDLYNRQLLNQMEARRSATVLGGFEVFHIHNDSVCKELLQANPVRLEVRRNNFRIILHPEQSDLPLEQRGHAFYNTLMAAWNTVKDGSDYEKVRFFTGALNPDVPCFEARSKYIDNWMVKNASMQAELSPSDEMIQARSVVENVTKMAGVLYNEEKSRHPEAKKYNEAVQATAVLTRALAGASPVAQGMGERGVSVALKALRKDETDADIALQEAIDKSGVLSTFRSLIVKKLVGKMAKDGTITAETVDSVLYDTLCWPRSQDDNAPMEQ